MIKIPKPLLLLGFTLLTTSAFAAETATGNRQLSALPAPISSEELSALSGGASPTGLAVTNQTLSALNADNSVSAGTVITGQVSLQPGTFSGIGNFVFNTGNNNNVQGTLSVTILTPPMN